MKAANQYLGLVEAYCDLCNHSRANCHDLDIVHGGFSITRTVADLHSIFEKVADNNGVIVKQKYDYGTKEGLKGKPIPNHEVTSIKVLHALLRSFDHYMKIAFHLFLLADGTFNTAPDPYRQVFMFHGRMGSRRIPLVLALMEQYTTSHYI